MLSDALRVELIEETARREWANPRSISSLNQRSIPEEARDGFPLFADMTGVCVLEPTGTLRVFLHMWEEEIDVDDQVVRGALRHIKKHWPHLLADDRHVQENAG